MLKGLNIKKKSFKIGLTGGAGIGKTTLCKEIEKNFEAVIINSDKLSKKIVEKGSLAFLKIKEKFGEDYIAEDGNLNRKKIRNLIVENNQARKDLENIVHPAVLEMTKKKMEEAQKKVRYVIVEVPLLFELNLSYLFDFTILISSTKEAQIKRLMQRDNINKKEAEALITIQMPIEEKKKYADYVISNNGSAEDMLKSFKEIIKKEESLKV